MERAHATAPTGRRTGHTQARNEMVGGRVPLALAAAADHREGLKRQARRQRRQHRHDSPTVRVDQAPPHWPEKGTSSLPRSLLFSFPLVPACSCVNCAVKTLDLDLDRPWTTSKTHLATSTPETPLFAPEARSGAAARGGQIAFQWADVRANDISRASHWPQQGIDWEVRAMDGDGGSCSSDSWWGRDQRGERDAIALRRILEKLAWRTGHDTLRPPLHYLERPQIRIENTAHAALQRPPEPEPLSSSAPPGQQSDGSDSSSSSSIARSEPQCSRIDFISPVQRLLLVNGDKMSWRSAQIVLQLRVRPSSATPPGPSGRRNLKISWRLRVAGQFVSQPQLLFAQAWLRLLRKGIPIASWLWHLLWETATWYRRSNVQSVPVSLRASGSTVSIALLSWLGFLRVLRTNVQHVAAAVLLQSLPRMQVSEAAAAEAPKFVRPRAAPSLRESSLPRVRHAFVATQRP
ncbi:hypothetical protein GGTG_09215 [Gaeumannomyces tritici R3-111a-1]|uniref:Uncharacterized protein n=1 Tax=Gaeumannomyces tritici (strain R3-111a-1) TaxID=644352 RepID=J3P6S3_GAET3|nr:hypothetical protein GGTG_09215 [Gaeumannomyces tritici R3-111a-1]EJT72349.1 hypothetical protein GGTG_09215 [Gaeumannomyces tritici R3-111a-1]